MIRIAYALLLVPAVALAQQRVECPVTLAAGAVTVTAPNGWTGGTSTSALRLAGAGMMAGPLESMTDLAPYESRVASRGSVATWRFAAGGEKWLTCGYGSGVEIARRLAR